MARKKPEIVVQPKGELELPCAGRCAGKTYHRVLARAEVNENTEEWSFEARYEVIECMGCATVSFRRWSLFSEDWDFDADGNMVAAPNEELFPSRIEGDKGMADAYRLPPKVANLYKETREALAAKHRVLAGIGIRALVEAVCADQGAQGKDLEKRIDDLVTRGILAAKTAEFLHGTRLLGNEAAHEAEAQPEDVLTAAMGAAEFLLLHAYLMEERTKPLPRRKKKAATTAAPSTGPAVAGASMVTPSVTPPTPQGGGAPSSPPSGTPEVAE